MQIMYCVHCIHCVHARIYTIRFMIWKDTAREHTMYKEAIRDKYFQHFAPPAHWGDHCTSSRTGSSHRVSQGQFPTYRITWAGEGCRPCQAGSQGTNMETGKLGNMHWSLCACPSMYFLRLLIRDVIWLRISQTWRGTANWYRSHNSFKDITKLSTIRFCFFQWH